MINTIQKIYTFAVSRKVKVMNVNQRIKKYSRRANVYSRYSLIRPPNLREQITFPITIPIRIRHKYIGNKNKKLEWIDNSSIIHWNRLTPNEILLAFEYPEYMSYSELIQGLEYLSKIQSKLMYNTDQQNYNWNQHIWINRAMNRVYSDFNRIKKNNFINVYKLMKKLNYQNQDFWKLIYKKIQEQIYILPHKDFQTLFMKYYHSKIDIIKQEIKEIHSHYKLVLIWKNQWKIDQDNLIKVLLYNYFNGIPNKIKQIIIGQKMFLLVYLKVIFMSIHLNKLLKYQDFQ